MEVTDLNAKPVAWVAKSGFGEAEVAGPRVGAIIDRTRPLQMQGTITKICQQEM